MALRDIIKRADPLHEKQISREYGLKSALAKKAKPAKITPVRGNKPSYAGESRN